MIIIEKTSKAEKYWRKTLEIDLYHRGARLNLRILGRQLGGD